MNKIFIFDTLKTIGQVAIISTTFGTYQQYSNNKIMQLNNENQNLYNNYSIERLETQHKKEINESTIRINKLDDKHS